MSDKQNIQNEDELWDLLSEPVTTEPAPKAAKSEPKAAKPWKAAKPEPTPVPEPAAEPAVKAAAPKTERKIDKFFLTCMVCVAVVTMALTLMVTSLLGGGTAAPSGTPVKGPADGDVAISETAPAGATDLEKENAELRAQLELQKEQIKDLQNDLMTLMGSEEYLSTASTDPTGSNEVLDAQVAAMETLAQIQEAYADFDRERLEELIPQMDTQLSYLTPEALNNYYLILEYVEQPSNDE